MRVLSLSLYSVLQDIGHMQQTFLLLYSWELERIDMGKTVRVIFEIFEKYKVEKSQCR